MVVPSPNYLPRSRIELDAEIIAYRGNNLIILRYDIILVEPQLP